MRKKTICKAGQDKANPCFFLVSERDALSHTFPLWWDRAFPAFSDNAEFSERDVGMRSFMTADGNRRVGEAPPGVLWLLWLGKNIIIMSATCRKYFMEAGSFVPETTG